MDIEGRGNFPILGEGLVRKVRLILAAVAILAVVVFAIKGCGGSGGNVSTVPHSASGKTDSNGELVLTLDSISFPFVLQNIAGDSITDVYIAAALEEGTTSRGAAVVVDPLSRYIVQIILLSGTESSSAPIAYSEKVSDGALRISVPAPTGHSDDDYRSDMSGVRYEIITELLGVATGKPTGKIGETIGNALEQLVLDLPCYDFGFCMTTSVSTTEMTTEEALQKDLLDLATLEGEKILSSFLPKNALLNLESSSNGIVFLKEGLGGVTSSIFSGLLPNEAVNTVQNSIYGVMGYDNVKRTTITVTLKNLPTGDLTLSWVFTEPVGEPEQVFGWSNPAPYPLDVKSGGGPLPILPSNCQVISTTTLGLGLKPDCTDTNHIVPPGNYLTIVEASGYNRAITNGSTNDAVVSVNLAVKSDAWLGVGKDGDGSGTVASLSPEIFCGTDCSEIYVLNTLVTLTANPAEGYQFDGWSGPCLGTGDCMLVMDADKGVIATFSIVTLEDAWLGVATDGTGSGTVTSNPAGIICGTECSEIYSIDTVVTLTASPDTDSTFTGWSGACSGTGSCTVVMDADKATTATFDSFQDSPFAGTLSGAWSGSCTFIDSVSGSFSFSILADGSVDGSFSGFNTGQISGSVTSTGDFSAATGSAEEYIWGGSLIESDGLLSGSGTWTGSDCSGSWSGP